MKLVEYAILTLFLLFSINVYGSGGQAIFQDPFDQAAGGTNLTRAAQEATLYSNPALLVFGDSFMRRLGVQMNVTAGVDSIEQAKAVAGQGDNTQKTDQSFIENLFTYPLHVGLSSTAAFVTSRFGISYLNSFSMDVAGKRHDQTGIPELRLRFESYSGGVIGVSQNFSRFFSLGVTAKYFSKVEPDVTIGLTDTDTIDVLQNDPQAVQQVAKAGTGLGYDVGGLWFVQGPTMDFRLALKVDDVGNTTYGDGVDVVKQKYHLGIGTTIHTSGDSIHLAADYRDATGVETTSSILRLHLGARIIIRNIIGFAAGLSQGYPTVGLTLNLWLFRVGASYYVKEMGTYAGESPRAMYLVYLATGI